MNTEVGIAFILTVTDDESIHPKEVPVTEYVVVDTGVAVILAPVIPLKPAVGDQL